jgi:hypothetical protein
MKRDKLTRLERNERTRQANRARLEALNDKPRTIMRGYAMMPCGPATPRDAFSEYPAMTAMTLFSLVFGEIAHAIKNGLDPFKGLERITLGYEPDVPGKHSTLIFDKEGNCFRLTVEPAKRSEW